MKKLPSVKALGAVIAFVLVTVLLVKGADGNKNLKTSSTIENEYSFTCNANSSTMSSEVNKTNEEVSFVSSDKEAEEEIPTRVEVYDGMTKEELASKLNRNLKSTLSGYGTIFAEYSLKYEVDPYVALAIVLHETGCASGKCSTLVSKCNNIGGMRGNRSCGSSGYGSFKSLNTGIDAFFKNLSDNYYKKGLNTIEKIGKKYAESKTWASRIHYYVQKIKAS